MVSRPDKSVTCTNCGGREREGSKRFNLPAASFPAAYYSGKGSWGLDRRAVSSPLNGCCFNTVLLIARSSPLVLRALTVSLKLAKIWATCSCVCLYVLCVFVRQAGFPASGVCRRGWTSAKQSMAVAGSCAQVHTYRQTAAMSPPKLTPPTPKTCSPSRTVGPRVTCSAAGAAGLFLGAIANVFYKSKRESGLILQTKPNFADQTQSKENVNLNR